MKLAIGAAISSLFLATAVSAASLSIVGGADVTLDGSHNPNYAPLAAFDPALVPTVGDGDTIKAFGFGGDAFDTNNGLALSDKSKISIMFLGKDANASNTVFNLAGGSLSNNGAAGATISAVDLPDWIALAFETIKDAGPESITNNVGQTDPSLSMAFYQENSKNVLAFFGDGRGDSDYDDMVVRISVVPLPAGGLLLLSAMGGFAVVRRKKKA
ncbi:MULTISPECIES: VPLPA-CTERM sorting domain-containing protein [unclassified Roseovarius]|uniref:VPLPA-CTERM sorting domain-containing protein n=1 Tax=unclassified Roseovarius TaxID=2614913 RepID=UPI00273DBE8B|nr:MULTISPECIES: VPLPA-CTERM sorting domain-containing protein [unclassified Roseovarius]